MKPQETPDNPAKKMPVHRIKGVTPGSIAEEMEIESGDILMAVNGQAIEDIFDYHYLTDDEEVLLLVQKKNGEEWELEIEKDPEEDLGLVFENGLMDEYRSCSNHCIFCFIDQMPKGMRETLYFKDDDSRLSFLQGNYVTLTNMKDRDIERIIHFHLAPINISVHTTNPQLRCEMLRNRFAGEALQKIRTLSDAGIEMNGQIVLCKGINDGAELERTIRDLTAFLPNMRSLSVVPVGLTKYRDGLYPLEPFEKEDARNVLKTVRHWQEECFRTHGTHFVHAGDEWFLLAEEELPEAAHYDGYLQLENGVGMLRLLLEEFDEALADFQNRCGNEGRNAIPAREVTFVTGVLAAPFLSDLAQKCEALLPQIRVHVVPVRNDFFGERITVSGLITGQDILAQLAGKELGDVVYLPVNMLRSGERILLDDLTTDALSDALQVPVDIVKSSGQSLLDAMIGREEMTGKQEP